MKINYDIPASLMTDLVITAFEGGINYWCEQAEAVLHTGKNGSIEMFRRMSEDEYEGFMLDRCGPYTNPGFWEAGHGYLIRTEDGTDTLTLARLREAMENMPAERAARIITEAYDAEDADVLVQLALFEEVVYG